MLKYKPFLFLMIVAAAMCGGCGGDSKPGYVRVEVSDLTPNTQLVVWVYPDDTPFSEMTGDGMYMALRAETVIPLNAFGEGAGTICFLGTDTPKRLKGWYAVMAFIDSNSNGDPDAGEKRVTKDIDVDGDTTLKYDNPEFDTAGTF